MRSGERLFTFGSSYKVVRQKGGGGCGAVYEVENPDGVHLALKLFDPDRLSTQKQKRFRQEVEFLRNPPSDRIVHALDSGATPLGKPFYVMRLYPGTLRDLKPALAEPKKALALFHQILDGVEAAHLKGVVHRDLKPENILYDAAAAEVAVADFGAAHFHEELLITTIETQPSERLLNVRYAAPEQREKGKSKDVDQRADICALGHILNELLTGDVAGNPGYPTVAARHAGFGYLDAIVEKMIRHNPRDRFQTIHELKEELIARGDEATTLQRLNALRNKVVPVGELDDPLALDPPSIVAAYARDDSLVLTLSREVSEGWISFFRAYPAFSYSNLFHPSMISISKNEIVVPVHDVRELTHCTDWVKNWLTVIATEYRREAERRLRSKEASIRVNIARKIAEEQKAATLREAARNLRF